jgi:hypothetical protein
VVTDRFPLRPSSRRKALFTRQGKPTVYVSSPDGFRSVAVQIARARNSDEVAISGVDAAARVALVGSIRGWRQGQCVGSRACRGRGLRPATRGSE